MPTRPYTWQLNDFLTPTLLNGELYRSNGALFQPNGVGFHAQRPLYRSFWGAPGAITSSAWFSPGGTGSGSALTFPVLADTGALFGHRIDPIEGGTILLSVPNSGGAQGVAGGLGLVSMFAPFAAGNGADIQAGLGHVGASSPSSVGTQQVGNPTYSICPWAMDIMDLNTGTPIAQFMNSNQSSPFASLTSTDGSGQSPRFQAHWASVYPANGTTISAIPSLTTSYSATTPLTAAMFNANIQQLMYLLNMPPLLRVASTETTSIPSGTATKINFPAATWDTYGGWSSSTDTYTVPLPGIYLVAGFVQFGIVSPSHVAAAANINGTTIWGPAVASDAGFTAAAKVGIFDLNAGDTIQLQGFQATGSTTNAQAGSILIVLYLGAQGIASPVPSTPDVNYSFTAGTQAQFLPGLLTSHIGNDLSFLLNKPYFLGYQSTAQNNATEGVSKALAVDTIKGLIHGSAGDPWSGINGGGWNATNLNWTAPFGGWYLAVEEIFAIPPTQPNASCQAALAVSPAGQSTPDFFQANNCASGVSNTGAAAVGYYYLRAGDSITPMFWENGFFNTGAVGTNVAAGTNSHFEIVFIGE